MRAVRFNAYEVSRLANHRNLLTLLLVSLAVLLLPLGCHPRSNFCQRMLTADAGGAPGAHALGVLAGSPLPC